MRTKALNILTLALVACATLQNAHSQPKSGGKTTGDLKLYAVDTNGNIMQNLVAGQYIALIAEADTAVFPDKATAGLSARAKFTTRVLGQPVAYSVNLPVANASASKLVDPTVETPTSGQKLGRELENKVWRERFDFYIPAEAPAGALSITIRAKATSANSVSRTFKLNIVRP